MIIDAKEARGIALRYIAVYKYLNIISEKIFEAAARGEFNCTYKIPKDEIGNLIVSDITTVLGNNHVGYDYPYGFKTSWELVDGFYLIHISWEEEPKLIFD